MKRVTGVAVAAVFSMHNAFGQATNDDSAVMRALGLVADDKLEEVVLSDTAPIDVKLKVGVERRVVFPAPVMVGTPNKDRPYLRTQSVERTVFLTATQPFDHSRVLARDSVSGKTWVLDISAAKSDVQHAAMIIDPAMPTTNAPGVTHAEPTQTPVAPPPKSATKPERLNRPSKQGKSYYDRYVLLTRHAAQQLYGPPRLAVGRFETVRVSNDQIPLLRGDTTDAQPIVAWTDGVYQVTAVKLTNTSLLSIVLDPRDLRGRWVAATFHHTRLGPKGSANASTAAYVVSGEAFSAAFGIIQQ